LAGGGRTVLQSSCCSQQLSVVKQSVKKGFKWVKMLCFKAGHYSWQTKLGARRVFILTRRQNAYRFQTARSFRYNSLQWRFTFQFRSDILHPALLLLMFLPGLLQLRLLVQHILASANMTSHPQFIGCF